MIIKANRHGNGAKLAAYLMDGGRHGERVHSPELHGFEEADNLFDALRDVEVLAEATKAEYPFLHVQVRLPDPDELSREQWHETANRIQARLGLTGQPRADVYHVDEKTGKMHLHLAISLIDEQTLKVKPLPYFKLRLKSLARELEKEFNITQVKNHRDGSIKYGVTKAEEQQAQRLGFDKEAVRNTIRRCWDAADCGRSFDAALAEAGLILAKGDRGHGNFLVIDPKGGLHVLGKRILDASAAQVRDRLSDLDRNNLPNVSQAREFMLDLPRDRMDKLTRELAEVHQQIKAEREFAQRDPGREHIAWEDALAKAAIEKEKKEQRFFAKEDRKHEARGGAQRQEQTAGEWPIQPPQPEPIRTSPRYHFEDAARATAEPLQQEPPPRRSGDIRIQKAEQDAMRDARAREGDPKLNRAAFAEQLERHGLAFARVTGNEAYRSHRHADFARELGNYAPRFKEGEIVVITEPGLQYHRDGQWKEMPRVHKLDQTKAEKYLALLTIDKKQLQGIDATKSMLDARAEQRAADRRSIHEVFEDSRQHARRTAATEKAIRSGAATARDAIHKSAGALGKAASVAGSIGKTLDVIGGILESLAAPKFTPEQKLDADNAKSRREVLAEDHIEFSRYVAQDAQQRQNRENQFRHERGEGRERDR
jgi:Relaxase/Mobilisation nuclease domain